MSSLPITWQECPGCRGAMLPGAPRCGTCGISVHYCPAPNCHKPIYPDQHILSFTSGKAQYGEKSRQIYEKRTDDTITMIHYGCVIANFHPNEDRIVFDSFAERLGSMFERDKREQIIAEYEESRDQTFEQEVKAKVAEITEGRVCIECWEEIEEETQQPQQQTGYENGYAPLAGYPTR